MNTKKRIIISVISIVAVIGLIGASILFFKKPKADAPIKGITQKFDAIERDTKISVDGSGNLQITRNRVENTCELDDDSWTILVYMCGVDRHNLDCTSVELDGLRKCGINSSNSDKFNIVLQTGSNEPWYNYYDWLGTNTIKRSIVNEKRKWTTVEELGEGNMGDSQTFIDFLEWGLTTYPAEHTMLILYDHGGTGLGGICYDPYHNDDYLSINELEYSLAKTKKHMKKPFDLAVMAACSTGSLEYANALAPYADYMVGSANYVSCYGFDLGTPAKKIIKQPDIDTYELAKYYTDCINDHYDDYHIVSSSMAVASYNLKKLDPLLIEVNNVFKQVYEKASVDKDACKEITQYLTNPKHTYTYDSRYQKDIGSFLSVIRDFNIDTSKAVDALNKYYVRWWKGKNISKKSVCTTFMFMHEGGFFGKGSLNICRNTLTSPYHMNLLELSSHLAKHKDLTNFKKYDWATSKYFFEDTFDFMNYSNTYVYKSKISPEKLEKVLKSNPNYVAEGFVQNWMDNAENKPIQNRIESEKLEVTYADNSITTKINDDAIDVARAYNSIYAKIDGVEYCLGENADVSYNNDTRTITNNFKGEWLVLGDGQLLTTYVHEITDEYTIYVSPVYSNETESTLYIKATKDNIEPLYICYAPINGEVGNVTKELTTSISFSPIYDIWNDEEKTYDTEYGEDYTIKGSNDILYSFLEDGEYSFSTVVDDLIGTHTYSKPKKFTMKDNVISFNE